MIAIAWTLHNSAVTGAIVGVRSEQQLKEIIDAAGLCLSEDDVTFLSPSPSSESSLSSETLKE